MGQVHFKWLNHKRETEDKHETWAACIVCASVDLNGCLRRFLSCPTPVSVFSCCCLCRPHISKKTANTCAVLYIFIAPRSERCVEWNVLKTDQLPFSNVLVPVHIVLNHLLNTTQQRKRCLHVLIVQLKRWDKVQILWVFFWGLLKFMLNSDSE